MRGKIFWILLSFIILGTAYTYADESDTKWDYIGQYMGNKYYINTRAAYYNREDKSVSYWERCDYIPGGAGRRMWGWTVLTNKTVDLVHKKLQNTYVYEYMRDLPAGQNGKHGYQPEYKTSLIMPDSLAEKEVNAVCAKEHIMPLWYSESHTWKWIKSTKQYNYYICTDVDLSDPGDNGTGIVFVKKEDPEYPTDWPWVRLYFIDYKQHRVVEGGSDYYSRWIAVSPDSVEEAVYNTASAMAVKQRAESGVM